MSSYIVHDYVLDGTKILSETVTEAAFGISYTMYYVYDANGSTNNAVGGGGFGLSGDDIGGLAESPGADGLPGLFSRNWDPESAWKMLGH